MKVSTWNVNSIRVRLPQMLDWLARESPDVLCIQETKVTDDQFPLDAVRDAGYQAIHTGQKAYNGVAILSRHAVQDESRSLNGVDDAQKRYLAATVNGVRIVNVYVPNGEAVDSDKYRYKLDWLAALRAGLSAELQRHSRLAVVGDYNIAPEPRDVHDPKLWEGRVLFSDPERAAFRALTDLGLIDAFRLFDQPERSFSWWDYRMAGFKRNHGLRIDHILLTPALADACRGCHIDTAPRRLERPSDHAPVIAELDHDAG